MRQVLVVHEVAEKGAFEIRDLYGRLGEAGRKSWGLPVLERALRLELGSVDRDKTSRYAVIADHHRLPRSISKGSFVRVSMIGRKGPTAQAWIATHVEVAREPLLVRMFKRWER